MTPDEQRIAIAEFCGWWYPGSTSLKLEAWAHWVPPEGARGRIVPDYLNDLNAIHEAEKKLTGGFKQGDQWLTYIKLLHAATCGRGECATATQRAEALLRTLNLWKETKAPDVSDLDSVVRSVQDFM